MIIKALRVIRKYFLFFVLLIFGGSLFSQTYYSASYTYYTDMNEFIYQDSNTRDEILSLYQQAYMQNDDSYVYFALYYLYGNNIRCATNDSQQFAYQKLVNDKKISSAFYYSTIPDCILLLFCDNSIIHVSRDFYNKYIAQIGLNNCNFVEPETKPETKVCNISPNFEDVLRQVRADENRVSSIKLTEDGCIEIIFCSTEGRAIISKENYDRYFGDIINECAFVEVTRIERAYLKSADSLDEQEVYDFFRTWNNLLVSPRIGAFINEHNNNLGAWHSTQVFLPSHDAYLAYYVREMINSANEINTRFPNDQINRLVIPYWNFNNLNVPQIYDVNYRVRGIALTFVQNTPERRGIVNNQFINQAIFGMRNLVGVINPDRFLNLMEISHNVGHVSFGNGSLMFSANLSVFDPIFFAYHLGVTAISHVIIDRNTVLRNNLSLRYSNQSVISGGAQYSLSSSIYTDMSTFQNSTGLFFQDYPSVPQLPASARFTHSFQLSQDSGSVQSDSVREAVDEAEIARLNSLDAETGVDRAQIQSLSDLFLSNMQR